MLEDGIFVRGDWIADEANQDIATRFLRASFKRRVYCRDNLGSCLTRSLTTVRRCREGHQRWQLNEINALDVAGAQGSASWTRAVPAYGGHRGRVRL